MSEVSKEAGRLPAGEPRRRSAKAPGSAGRRSGKTTRLQLHVGEETSKRLGVHCALVGRNMSAEVDRLLLRFLAREGKGRELFSVPDDLPDAE